MIAYTIGNDANGDSWKNILVILNGNTSTTNFKLPAGSWMLAADENTINEKGIKKAGSGDLAIPATSAYILYSN